MGHRIAPSLLAAALASVALVAVPPVAGQTSGSTTATPPGTTSGSTATTPGTKGNAPMNSAAPPATAAAGSSSATAPAPTNIAAGDKKFVEKAVQGSVAEVQLGQLAVQKAQNPQVKKFGQQMIDDHSAANNKLQQIASQKGVTAPTSMDSATQREYDRLQKLSGAQFDREYMKHMVSDHEKDIKEFQSEAKSAKDSDIKSFAETTLPTLQKHLDMAKQAEAATSGNNKSASSS